MKKRIYLNMCLLTLISVVLTTLLLLLTFYNVFNDQMAKVMKSKAVFFAESINYSTDKLAYIHSLNLTNEDTRLSIIAQNGSVIFDSFKNNTDMENHIDRPEIITAFEIGQGEGTRFSSTLGEKTYYYAIKLEDGTVLRFAKTTHSIYGIFIRILPIIVVTTILIFLFCNFIACKLTKRIIDPINNIEFSQEQDDIYQELSPFIRTITQQKEQIHEQIKTLEDRKNTLKTITENMKDGMIILDKKGVVLSANKSAVELFHASLGDYAGRNIVEFVRNAELLDNIKQALLGQRCNTTLNFDKKVMQVFLSPVFEEQEINGVIALFLDITEKADTEKIRREFSANVSHELKTPLTTILGLSEMIENGMVKTQDINNFVIKIKNETSRLIDLVENIIRISELDEKKCDSQFEQFNLVALAELIVDSLRLAAEEKGVNLKIVGDDFAVTANKTMIHELLFNLIDNGIKYNQSGGSVTVYLSQESNKTRIAVADTGIGIPQQHIDRIFERFYRVDKSRSKKTGGTGLGLSIVKHVVQYHHGTVEIKSEENVGTTVTVII